MSLSRCFRGWLAALLVCSSNLAAQAVCGTPGKDGPGGTLTGIVNTYYPGLTASASGAGAITLGTAVGSLSTITPGDLLLIIQMQDAAINSANTSAYGAGTTTGSGSTNLNNAGRYEYVTATNSVGVGGGSLTFRGTGAGNGLNNTYTNAAATAGQGQRRYQVVRVPQYSQATLSSGLTAAYWNGVTGGVLAVDVTGQLTLGGTVNLDGRGFRGGAGLGFGGGAGGTNTDFRNLSSNPFHGIKGEGIAGTPRWVLNPQTSTNTDLGLEGYPNGDAARGAPGNAGGGGTDGNPSNNSENSGGGGGSNGGAGGQGGFSWSSTLDVGGRGGSAFGVAAVGRVVLGGGGGAGSRNNSTAPRNGGGAGGGIVLIRSGTITGTGSISANGLVGRSPDNDGAGGGGAGGSIVVLTASGGLGGLSIQARGGNGGDANLIQASAGEAHGPGGGGGGGAVVVSSAATVDVAAGVRGSTTTGLLAYGATNGGNGVSLTAAIGTSPGTSTGSACVPVLSVTKTTSTATVSNGSGGTTATYQIVVANAASKDTARNVLLLDTLPTGFTYTSSSAPVLSGGATRPTTTNPTGGDARPQWSSFSIPAGGSVSQTFVVAVASTVANGTYSNSARAIYLDPARATPTGTTSVAYDTTGSGENVTVQAPDLTITKTHVGSFSVGVNGTYSIVVRNSGTGATSGTITVVDTLPTGLGFVSALGAPWACGAVAAVVTCTQAAALAPATNAATITLTVSVAAGAAPAVSNRAWVSGGNEPTGNQSNNLATDPTTVVGASADVVTTKTGPATVAPGVNAVYSITALNNGPSPATNVIVTDTLPAGASFVSATGGGTLAGIVVTWPTVASLANGGSSTFSVTVTFASAGSYLNLAASTSTTTDPTPANNNGSAAGARVTTTVTATADVSVTNVGPGAAIAGTNVAYTITAANAGPSVAVNVVVTDTLPAGATFVSATGGGTLAGNVVTWPTIPSLATGAPTVYTLTLSYPAAGSYTNVVAATASTADPNLTNNRSPATTVVGTSADVVTTKTGPASVGVGVSATYAITALNNGPSTATNVVVTDTLPVGATFQSATAGGTLAGSVVTWPTVASLANGASVSFSVTVTYAATGSRLNLAASTATSTDPTPANNNGSAAGARVTTTVVASADIATTKTGPATVAAGSNATYTVSARNNGPSTATVVLITDTLPAGATFVSATNGGTLAGTVVTWPVVATITNGTTVNRSVTVFFAAIGSYLNIAASTATTSDPTPANNNGSAVGARVTTTVTAAAADVATTKTGPAAVAIGANATYVVSVRNNGPNSASNTVVRDTLPAGATFVSATNGGTLSGNVVTWPNVATIANGATITRSVTVTYAAAGSYLNLAASTSTTPDPTPADNNGSAAGARVTTTVTASADVVTTKTGPATVAAGVNATYVLTALNNGPNPATNVIITDTLPVGATFVSATGGGTATGNVVTWPTVASIVNAANVSFSVTVTFATAGSYLNLAASSATTTDPTPANNNGSAAGARVTTVVTPSADVAVTNVGPGTATAGTNVAYTITVTNNGPSPAANVVVTDTLPAGATFVSASGGGTLSGNVVTWPTIASLATGTPTSYTLTLSYPAAGTYANIAAAASTTSDPNLANNRAPASTVVGAGSADVATTKTGPATVAAGVNATYTITALNNGPSPAASVVLSDTLPVGATFVSATGGGTAAGNVVTWPAVASIATGANASFSVTVTYSAAGSYLNLAASTAATADPTPANNNGSAPGARVTTTVTPSADVVTTKTGPASVVAGANATYTITALNNGPSAAANVVVSDTLPAGATFVSATAGGTLSGNVVTWPAVASIANGGNAGFSVTVTFAATGSYLNLAASTATTPDPTPANNNGSAPGAWVTTTVTPNADVAITNVGPATATAGTNVAYTITATNNGPTVAANVVVTDTLPAGATFVSASGGGTLSGNVVTWPSIPSLATGTPTAFTLTLSYSAAGNYQNIAAVASTTADANLANNRAPATTAVGTSADVVTTKTGPASVAAGANATYPITALNNGPSAAANVIISDTLPVGATFVSATGGGTAAGNVVTWPAVVSIANGATAGFSVTVTFAAAGSYLNLAASTATTPDPAPANNAGSAPGARVTTTVTPSADVAVTNVGPATATAGTNVAYTITATNNGPSPAANVVVTDTLPAGATFVSASGGGTLSGNVVTWPSIASLVTGIPTSFTLTLTYPAAGTYANVAAAVSTTPDPNLANNRAPASTVIGSSADVVTTKTGPATVAAGVSATYTITALNNGPSTALAVVVTDTLPVGATFVSATGGGTAAGNVVTWPAVASLANGANSSVSVTVSFAAAGSYLNLAASSSATPDPTPANNDGSAPAARVTTTVSPSADVAITNVGPATATAGTNVVYTLTATNNGPSPATNVVVTDTLPVGAVFVSATGGGTLSGNVVTWPTIASLATGTPTAYTVTVTYPGAGTFTSPAAVVSSTPDPNPANNRDPATTVVGLSADVVTTKTGPATATAGTNVAYTITALNNGPSPAATVVVTDTLPPGATFVSATGGGTLAGGVVTWPAAATIASGASISFDVTVAYAIAGSYLNLAASSSPTPDPTPANNDGSAPAARVTTAVAASADLSVTNVGPATVTAGVPAVYTITTTNAGPSPAINVVVTDTLPAGATFVSATGGGTLSGNVVTWPAIPSLGTGVPTVYTMTVTYAAGGSYTNIAAAASPTPDPNLTNNRAPATTVVGASADVVTTKTGPAAVAAGVDITYTITTANNGPSAAVNVVVSDTLPAGLTFISATNGGTLSGSVVTWPAIASLAAAANQSYTVVARASSGGAYTNIVASTSTTPDPTPGNNDGSAPAARVATVVAPSADVVTTKSGPATVAAGQDISYTVTTINNGPSTATGIVVTDTLPVGLTFVSATNGGTLSGSVVTWPTIASLAAAGTQSYTVVARTSVAGSYTNVVASTATTSDPTPANNNGSAPAARATTVVTALADVATTKTGPATATAGVDFSYTITTVNNGPSAAADLIVVDTLPAGLVFVSATGGGTLAAGIVSFPVIASLANGASSIVTITVRPTTTGSYTNSAASTSTTPDGTPANNNGSAPASRVTTVVGASADLVTTKVGPATATAGQDITFTVTTTNNGPSTASAIVVTDTLPAGLTLISASNGGTLSGSVITWPAIPTLANGAAASFTIVARASDGGTYVNLAASTSPTPDPSPANNDGSAPAARATVVIAALADVVTTKSGPATGTIGQDLTFTIGSTNNGPSAAANVVVTDTLPAGLVFVSASGGGTASGNVVTWPTIASLAATASQSFVVVARPSAAGTFVNIVASSSATTDPTPFNNNGSAPAARVTVVVAPAADVVTTKTGPAAVTVAQDIVYTVSATNNGPSAAASVVVTDTLPAGLTFVSATGGGTASGNVVTWPAIASLVNGATTTFTVTARASATGTYLNVAASTSPTADPAPTNNDGSLPASQVSTVVGPSADLITTKTGPATATAGQDINYTITTLNNGPSAATSIVVSDTLPAGLTFVSASNGGTVAGGVITWPVVASLANGASLTYSVLARATDAGSYQNLAASTSATPDPTPNDHDGSAPNARVTTVVAGSADLETTKTGPPSATAGQDVTYTITTLNNGPSAALNVVVTDTLAAGATFVTASNGGTVSGNVVTWPAAPSLANGATLVYTVTVRFAAAAGYLDIGASSSPTGDPVPDNNDGSLAPARVITVVGASADLVTTKAGPAAVSAGQDVTYTITAVNNGPSAAVDVVVTDTLPAGANLISATGGGTLAGNVITWPAVASLASGANVVFSAVVRYTVPGNYLNIAASTSTTPDPTPTNNDGAPPDGRVNTAVGPNADVVTTKTGPATANAGEDIGYTITVTNSGPTTATGIVVTDTLPAGFVFVSASAGGTLSGNVVTWPVLATLANGAGTTFTIVARATTAGSFVNQAASTATTPDPDFGNNDGSLPAAQVTTVVGLQADVVTSKTGPATALVGQAFNYDITVLNTGPSSAANVVVTDTLPAGLTFVGATAGGTLAGTVVTWPTIASLASGIPVTFTVTVRAVTAGSYTNVVASTSTTADPTPANNTGQAAEARVVTVVSNNADLRVTKTGPASATVGTDIGYTVTVVNDGPATAAEVVVTDTLPAGTTFVSASGSGVLTGNVVTWPTLVTLAAGGSQVFTVTLRAGTVGAITNLAAALSPSPDPTPANNRAAATTTVTAGAVSADVITTKSGPATVTAGANVVFTIQTINAGPSAAVDVVITDTLPAGITFVSATGNPTRSGNVLTWPVVPTLANGASVTFTVTLQAPPTGSFTNIAASASPTPDPTLSNNNGSANNSRTNSTVAASADLVTTKTGPALAGVGGQITYTIATRNDGPDAAASVVVTDSLPAGALFVSASNGGVFANGVVTWPTLASLPNGATLTYTLTLVLPNVSQVVNVARSGSTTADPILGNNRGTATTTIAASADVVTTKTGPTRVDAGATIVYTIKTKNLGPQAAVGVTVVDSLPVGAIFGSASGGGSVAGRVVTWPLIPSLAVGDSVLYTLTITAPTGATQLTNVVASTAATSDPNPGNNDGKGPGGTVTTDVSPVDLAVTKAHTGDFIPGAIATYTITVSNVGPVPTTGPVTVTDTLPAGLTYRSFAGAGLSCSNLGRVVTCQFSTVPFAPGATTTLTLKVLVGATAANTVVNRVVISTPGDTDESGNNVATDSATLQRVSPLAIEKVASRTDVEIGDVIDYTVIVSNRTATEVPDVSVTDELPRGFTYQRATARADRLPIADPAGAPGPKLTFPIGNLGPNASVRLTYRVKLGAGSTLGDGINRAQAKSSTGIVSSTATAVVRVARGVFTDRGIIFGKVTLSRRDSVRADSTKALVHDSVGIPGVRIFLEDGTSVVTDLKGKYNLYGIVSGLHALRVDPTTLPAGARLIDIDSRNARDGSSRFVDLKNGELHKADFQVRFVDSVGATTGLRRDQGEITSIIIDSLAGTERPGQDRPVIAVDAASDTAKVAAYRPLSAQSSANPIDEANRLPITRLPGTTVPITAIPNGSVELVPARRTLPADGNTAIAVRVKVLDQDRHPIASEQPITLEASLGRWLANDLDPVEPGVQAVLANGQGDFTLVASSEAGVGEIRVTNGLRVSTAQIVFLPASRPMLVNGLVEARIDLRSLLKNGLTQVTSGDRFERELTGIQATSDDGRFSAAARGALFLQGKVKGSTLLTLAYDTENDPERRMFRDIQPDEFYPVYGDASIKEFGAQSFGRLYVRVDADRSFALYGDYVTPSAGSGALAARELGAYQRSLTGALVHGETRNGQFNVFASRDRLSQVVEEIPGQGISGPYQLRRSDGRINSEKVEIVTRDRNQPSRIIKSVPLSRFTDYTLEAFTGRLLFFAPVPSVDADLNPVSIRVLYEVERAGQEFWVYGADGQLKLGDRAEIGAGIVRDEQPFSNRNLYSANGAIQVAPGTVLVAEVAHTGGDSAGFRGDAARFELRHASAKFQGTVFGATSDVGFSNQSSTFQRGRSELGLRGSAVVNDRTRIIGEALRSEDKTTGRTRDGFLAAVERQFGKSLRAELGYRYGSDSVYETNALRTRVTFQLPKQPRASVFGEFEQDLKQGDQRRGALGGQYVLFDRLRLYGRHEFLSSFAGPFALNGSQRQATTVIGLDAGYTKDGQFFGEYRASDAFSGRQTEAAIGLRNRWNLRRGLVLNTGFERVDVLKGSAQGEATALTAGVEYTTNPLWRGTARFEYRFTPNGLGDNFLATLGYVRKLDRDWTVLGRALYNTFGDGGKRTRNQIGFAWRETDHNRWNGLARWENRYERLAPNSASGTVLKSTILSAHLNYQPLKSVWLSSRLAGKWATDESNGLTSSNRAVLGSVRALYDFLPSWDAGVIGSLLSSNGRQYGIGFEAGRIVVTNMRVAVGYNVFGFKNQDLASDGATTDRGLYLHFGFKFSEDLFKRQP